MPDDHITSGEFGRFRVDFNARIADLGDRIDARFDTIDSKFTDLNGRTRTQAEAIVRLDARVGEIATRGCGQFEAHRNTLDAIPLEARRTSFRDWHPAAKAGAVTGSVGILTLLVNILNRILQHLGI
jgi:hypothetical protein